MTKECVKGCLIKWANTVYVDIMLDQWENTWNKRLKFMQFFPDVVKSEKKQIYI